MTVFVFRVDLQELNVSRDWNLPIVQYRIDVDYICMHDVRI